MALQYSIRYGTFKNVIFFDLLKISILDIYFKEKNKNMDQHYEHQHLSVCCAWI